jgi:3-hydroxyisobutyrate dehydrogenase
MSKIAFLGLGNMGRSMAENLLAAGHSLTVFNRTEEKARAIGDKGAIVAKSPAEAVEDVDAIISMVTNDDASRAIWLGDDGVIRGKPRPRALAIESSTVSRRWLLELSTAATGMGLRFLDCPVAGRPDIAAAGQLAVFAGGSEENVEAAKPILDGFAKSVTRFGPIGSGIAFKLIYNVMGASQVVAVAEAMAACAAADIELSAAADAFANGTTGSPHVRKHAKAMATRQYDRPVHFTPVGRIKDLNYGIELAEEVGCKATIGLAARSAFQQMVDGGRANLNDSELFEFLSTR